MHTLSSFTVTRRVSRDAGADHLGRLQHQGCWDDSVLQGQVWHQLLCAQAGSSCSGSFEHGRARKEHTAVHLETVHCFKPVLCMHSWSPLVITGSRALREGNAELFIMQLAALLLLCKGRLVLFI